VTNFNRPGGNMTGIVPLTIPPEDKRLELLHALVECWARKVGNAARMATSATELSAPAWHSRHP
jgi:hypothetical protein